MGLIKNIHGELDFNRHNKQTQEIDELSSLVGDCIRGKISRDEFVRKRDALEQKNFLKNHIHPNLGGIN